MNIEYCSNQKIIFSADRADSLYWDHLFRKRPAAVSDDIVMDSCVWTQINNSCMCRGDELHCQNKGLTQIPINLPDDGITLL